MPITELPGIRLPDTPLSKLPLDITPGTYWKVTNDDGTPLESPEDLNLTGTVWFVSAPMSYGFAIGRLTKHTVRENRDGTISVLPQDGSSNSILITGHNNEQWHGYIYRGIWRHC